MALLIRWLFVALIIGLVPPCGATRPSIRSAPEALEAEVLIYSATPSGILSAFAVKRAGRSVVIVEPSRWVGGILGSGLKPTQDMPNYEAVGGKTRELVLRLGMPPALGPVTLDQAGLKKVQQWTRQGMSPRDVRASFLQFLQEQGIRVIYDHRISRTLKEGATLREALFDLAPFDSLGRPVAEALVPDRLRVRAKIFIDASYDGELMVRSGVSYRVGRESVRDYEEELAGVLPVGGITQVDRSTEGHGEGIQAPISPFVEPNNPASGLLPLLDDDHGKSWGAGDHYTQAYNFRYYVTADPARRESLTPPEDYDPAQYELVGRYVEYLKGQFKREAELFEHLSWIFPGWMNAGEYNYHRGSLISMAPLGISHLYADGDYATKARIWRQHQDYLRGLHHFLSTDRRVPEEFRKKTASLGLDRYHHPQTHGWPHQLYIRVGRRMVGRYTITAHDVYNRTRVDDPIGLAQYGVDTYPARRIWTKRDGVVYVATEGNMFVGGARGPTNVPYSIPYRAITPQKSECTNLLVPVSFSASHLGYASARMEPTFMIVGESAGVAAAHALQEGVAVQEIDLSHYLTELKAVGQRLIYVANDQAKTSEPLN